MSANCSAPIMPVVSGVFGMWIVTKSLCASRSSSSAGHAELLGARGVTYGSYATTVTPNACRRAAMSAPMRPRPMMPTVFSKSSVPVNELRFQAPAASDACAAGMWRARLRMCRR
jgi:hypothetical protein